MSALHLPATSRDPSSKFTLHADVSLPSTATADQFGIAIRQAKAQLISIVAAAMPDEWPATITFAVSPLDLASPVGDTITRRLACTVVAHNAYTILRPAAEAAGMRRQSP